MKVICKSVRTNELWLTVENVYDVEEGEINKYFPALDWLKLKEADDGFPCYARREQFERVE